MKLNIRVKIGKKKVNYHIMKDNSSRKGDFYDLYYKYDLFFKLYVFETIYSYTNILFLINKFIIFGPFP